MNRLSRLLPVIAVLGMPLFCQVMVEHAILTGGSGTAGVSGAGSLGRSLDGAFSKAAKGASAAKVTTSTSQSGSMIVLTPPKSKTGVVEPDVAIATPSRAALEQVTPGMTRQELIAKLGTPFFALSQSDRGNSWETITYRIDEGGNADFRLTEGKVESVKLPPSKVKPSIPMESDPLTNAPKQ